MRSKTFQYVKDAVTEYTIEDIDFGYHLDNAIISYRRYEHMMNFSLDNSIKFIRDRFADRVNKYVKRFNNDRQKFIKIYQSHTKKYPEVDEFISKTGNFIEIKNIPQDDIEFIQLVNNFRKTYFTT